MNRAGQKSIPELFYIYDEQVKTVKISTLLTIQDVTSVSLTIEEKYIWGLLCQEISMVSPDLQIYIVGALSLIFFERQVDQFPSHH